METKIMVSIICNTYNHVQYIGKALSGFVNQKCDFDFEILVHDDASSDGTQLVIKEYEKKYPKLVKPIYQKENQYSKKKGIIQKIQEKRANGKYIALCEGDDYWTDSNKLQKQYDVMEDNQDIDLCVHAVAIEKKRKIVGVVKPSKGKTILSIENTIINGGSYVGTCSIFYRKELNDRKPAFREKYGYDYALQLQGALRNGMLFLPDIMGVYRIGTEESWTQRVYYNKDQRIIHNDAMIKMLTMFNDYSCNLFKLYIDYKIECYKLDSAISLDDTMGIRNELKKLKSKEYIKIYDCFKPVDRFKQLIKINFCRTLIYLKKFKF